jgi:hypothetical protein
LNGQENNSQSFKISLNKIAAAISKISFVLTLHEAKERQQNFGMLNKISVTIKHAINKTALVSYQVDNVTEETALILAELYRYNGEWKFKAVGQGYINGLDVLARNYGVNLDSDTETTPPPKPEPIPKPAVVKYTELIQGNIAKFKEKAKNAKHENIKAYLSSHFLRLFFKTGFEKHISQALLTNGVEWKLFYVIPKRLKKYEYQQVFSINLLEFNSKVAEKLYSISRFGVQHEKSLENIKAKMQALNAVDEVILTDEILEKIAQIINNKNQGCQVSAEEVRSAIENNILNSN